jgi:DNA-binding beta-propeller fold protein YncE
MRTAQFSGRAAALNCTASHYNVSVPRFATLARQLALIIVAPLLLTAATAPALKQIAVLDIPGRPGFDEIAMAHGMILVSHGGAGTVDLFDPQKRRIVGHIRDMSSPRGVAVDEAGQLVYIANSGARNIVVVSTSDWKVTRTIPVESAPDELFLIPAEHLLFMTFPDSQSIAVLDLAGNGLPSAANQTTKIEGRPAAFAYDGSHHRLYLTLQDRRSVLVLDLALKTIGRFDLNGSEPTGIVFSSRHNRLYVAVRYAVLALDPGTGQETSRSAVAGGIDELLLDEASDSLLGVANGSVFVIPATTALGPANEVPVEVKGHTLAYDSVTGLLYLPGGREGRSKLLILKRVNMRPPS